VGLETGQIVFMGFGLTREVGRPDEGGGRAGF
jgi:hypothetical protein